MTAKKEEKIIVGDIYEACNCHPVLCSEVDYEQDHIEGISLIDGRLGYGCSLKHCGVFKMTVAQALKVKEEGPSNPDWKQDIEKSGKAWWAIKKQSHDILKKP